MRSSESVRPSPGPEPERGAGTRWVVVGSGTLRPDGDRGSPAHLVETPAGSLLLDCGPGTVHGLARAGCDWRGIRAIWISHFHTDHMGDLPGLMWAWAHEGRTDPEVPVMVVGPRGLEARWAAMARAFGSHMNTPGSPLRVQEVEPEEVVELPGLGLELQTRASLHTAESMAVRILDPRAGWSTVYTSDTAAFDGLGRLVQGADLVVAACALPDPPDEVPHLTPETLARVLDGRNVPMVVTTHAYPDLDPAAVPDLLRRAGYTGRAVHGSDGFRIPLGASPPPTSFRTE